MLDQLAHLLNKLIICITLIDIPFTNYENRKVLDENNPPFMIIPDDVSRRIEKMLLFWYIYSISWLNNHKKQNLFCHRSESRVDGHGFLFICFLVLATRKIQQWLLSQLNKRLSPELVAINFFKHGPLSALLYGSSSLYSFSFRILSYNTMFLWSLSILFSNKFYFHMTISLFKYVN